MQNNLSILHCILVSLNKHLLFSYTFVLFIALPEHFLCFQKLANFLHGSQAQHLVAS